MFFVPLALGAAAGLAQGLPSIVGSPQEKANRERLRELQAMGAALGLTEQERQELEGRYIGAMQNTQDATQRTMSAYAAGSGGGGSGQALLQGQLAAARTEDLASQAAREINAADIARRRELEQELEDRLSFQAQTRKARMAGLLAPLGGAAQGAMIGYNQALDKGQANEAWNPFRRKAAAPAPAAAPVPDLGARPPAPVATASAVAPTAGALAPMAGAMGFMQGVPQAAARTARSALQAAYGYRPDDYDQFAKEAF